MDFTNQSPCNNLSCQGEDRLALSAVPWRSPFGNVGLYGFMLRHSVCVRIRDGDRQRAISVCWKFLKVFSNLGGSDLPGQGRVLGSTNCKCFTFSIFDDVRTEKLIEDVRKQMKKRCFSHGFLCISCDSI